MAQKEADLHTLAPRLSYVEDQAQWLMDNRESGGGGKDPSPKLKKLWLGLLDGTYTTGYDEPWNYQPGRNRTDLPDHRPVTSASTSVVKSYERCGIASGEIISALISDADEALLSDE